MKRPKFLLSILAASCVLGLAFTAFAVTTKSFVLDSAKLLSEGKLDGTAVNSDGTVVRGVSTERIALEGVKVARSLLTTPDGRTLIGTSNDGKIYALAGNDVKLFAETKQLMVTSMVSGPGGVTYAGTLPKGKILAVDAAGKVSTFSEPKDVEHIWALVYDAKNKTLYAATGPNGQVFAIDAKGKAEVYHDSEAVHVMALAREGDGPLYAGTSDEALLLRLTAPGQAEVVYDFEGNEVTAIDVRDGQVAVAANLFPKAPSSKKSKTDNKSTDNKDDKKKKTAKNGTKPAKAGKGQLWRIAKDGRARQLFDSPKGHITDVQWGPDGVIYAATGKDGHIHRVTPDGHHALWVDVDERQVLAIDLSSTHPRFVTGDAGAIYRVRSGEGQQAMWTSKVLDASFHARFGQLSWRGEGKLSFQTRSGNTKKADDTWSEWSTVTSTPGPVRSPAARFLQLRAHVGKGATLYAATAYYLPRNQPAIVAKVKVAPKATTSKAKTSSASRGASSLYEVSYDAANPDGDKLRYRIGYRREGGEVWRPLHKETVVVTKKKFSWPTDGVADGYYRVRVESSDELENPRGRSELHATLSEPVLVDNHPPRVEQLELKGGKLRGRAVDSMGPISRLEYKLDAEDWRVFYPDDALLDTATERFDFELPTLDKGAHAIAVRARDARGNIGSAEIEVTIR